MFKIGDREELTEDYAGPKKGAVGTVKGIGWIGYTTSVEFDEPFENGHDCDGKCEANRGYWINNSKIKPIKEEATQC